MPTSPDSSSLVVVGTPETIDAALRQLDSSGASDAARPFGVIVLDGVARASAEAMGMRVLGTVEDIPGVHGRTPFDRALVTLPSAMERAIDRVREELRSLGVDTRFMPTLEDVLGGSPEESRFGGGGVGVGGSLDVQRLIGRAPTAIDPDLVSSAVTGRRVLITGAGGSIGSELARICGAFEPSELTMVERSENALFDIDGELGRRYPDLSKRAVLHDVVEPEGTMHRFAEARPEVVFHAAAHKHVPMMEDHPSAALNNNLFGTKSVADAARATGCGRFVLISTDKAVNPSSVMGATKRLAELYVRSLNTLSEGGTRCSLVRFGNVLGSACSVLPIWTRQLSEGGPITVTHEAMTRYFMTIPEAASLVIQASTLDPGSTGGVYELDMGEPVRILELAERFVRMHGFEPVFDDGRLASDPPKRGNRANAGAGGDHGCSTGREIARGARLSGGRAPRDGGTGRAGVGGGRRAGRVGFADGERADAAEAEFEQIRGSGGDRAFRAYHRGFASGHPNGGSCGCCGSDVRGLMKVVSPLTMAASARVGRHELPFMAK